MDIKRENLIAAYNAADDNGKNMLKALCPDIEFEKPRKADKRPVTERVKTLEDAINELGQDHPLVREYNSVKDMALGANLLAYIGLGIVCAALNEDWEPQFTKDEWRYFPWFYLYTQDEIDDMSDDEKQNRRLMSTGDYQTEYAGFAYARSNYVPAATNANVGSRLCLKSDTLAVYCGKQFINLWADFNLIRRENLIAD